VVFRLLTLRKLKSCFKCISNTNFFIGLSCSKDVAEKVKSSAYLEYVTSNCFVTSDMSESAVYIKVFEIKGDEGAPILRQRR
jgi:hypothetical protein